MRRDVALSALLTLVTEHGDGLKPLSACSVGAAEILLSAHSSNGRRNCSPPQTASCPDLSRHGSPPLQYTTERGRGGTPIYAVERGPPSPFGQLPQEEAISAPGLLFFSPSPAAAVLFPNAFPRLARFDNARAPCDRESHGRFIRLQRSRGMRREPESNVDRSRAPNLLPI